MRIKDLKSKLNIEMEALVPDVLKSAKAVPIVNNLLPFGTQEQQFRQKLVMRMLFATCCVFFSMLIVTAAYFIGNYFKGPTPASMTYLTLYVAPSVGDDVDSADYNAFDLNFAVDKSEKVLLVAASGEGSVLDGINFRFVPVETVILDILTKAWDDGLFADGDQSIITIAALNDHQDVGDEIARGIYYKIRSFLNDKARQNSVSTNTAEKSALTAWAATIDSSANNNMAIDELISILNTWYIETT